MLRRHRRCVLSWLSSLLLSSAVFFITTPFCIFYSFKYTFFLMFRLTHDVVYARIRLQCYYKLINFYDIIFFFDNINHKWYQIVILFYFTIGRMQGINKRDTHNVRENFIEKRVREWYAMKDFSLFCVAAVFWSYSEQRKCLAHDRQHINGRRRRQLGRMLAQCSCSFPCSSSRHKHTYTVRLPIAAFSPLLVHHDIIWMKFVWPTHACFSISTIFTPLLIPNFPSVFLLVLQSRLSDNIYLWCI